MTKAKLVDKLELGTKRSCADCGTKFYDFKRTPVVCPKCEAVYLPPVVPVSPPAAKPQAAPKEEAPVKVVVEPELVSLEEAEKEQAPAKGAADVIDDADLDLEDEPLGDEGEDDTFLENDEEDEEDVSGLLGSDVVAGDEET